MADPAATDPPPLRAELPRKLGHMAVGLCALLLRWFPAWLAAAGAAGAIVFNLFYVHRVTRDVFLREAERVRRFSAGVVLYPVAVFGLLLVFYHRLELAAAAWAIMAFGDAAAGLAGLSLRGPALPWNPRKRWSGLVAFVLVGTATAALLLRWTQLSGPSTWVGASFVLGGAGLAGPSALWLWATCAKAAGAAALVESMDTGWEDNVAVAATAAAVLWLGSLVDPQRTMQVMPHLISGVLVGAAITALPALAARLLSLVSTGGALLGWLLTALLYGAAGGDGLVVFGAFFVLAAVATRLGWSAKAERGLAQDPAMPGGRRGPGNALANTVVGLACAMLAALSDASAAWTLAMTAAFATAAFDTVASEIGKAFGGPHLLSTALRPVPPGTPGAVSLGGSAAGLVAAACVATTALVLGIVSSGGAAAAVAGAVVGVAVESFLGASLPRGGTQRGAMLNVLNTAVGAATAWGIHAALAR